MCSHNHAKSDLRTRVLESAPIISARRGRTLRLTLISVFRPLLTTKIMNCSEEDIAEVIRDELPGTEEIIVQYLSGYLLELDDAAEDEDVLQVTRTILESATPSTSSSSQDVQLEKLMQKLGDMLEEPLRIREEKNVAGKSNGLVRLDKVMDMSKAAVMSSTIALGEGVDLESINKGK